ncbi:MAG: hypothetical protein P4L83_12110 [Nevskia sp.]|nr:hypothetical protein [Nevskia sp.]
MAITPGPMVPERHRTAVPGRGADRARRVLLGLCIVAGAVALPAWPASAWSSPWVQPLDPAAAAGNSDEYAWRLFVALNWPADPVTGAPDPGRNLGDDSPVVWEYWRNASRIFLKDGADPGPWEDGAVNRALRDADRYEGLPLDSRAPTRHIVNGVMVAVTDPLAAASHLNETHMNRASFEFIRERRLYSLQGQLDLIGQDRPVSFPAASRNVKAQWRPIDASQKSRYYTVEVAMADGSRRLYGLTALHIATKDLPDWFWGTFEHVDNPSALHAEWRLPSRDRFSCVGQAADCSQAPRGIGLEGTVWQNYRLRGTMTGFVDAQGKPTLLANAQLEAGVVQSTSSCITCHARASIGVVDGKPGRLAVFDDAADPRGSSAPANGPRPGFYGTPKPEWFIDGSADGGGRRQYVPLDAVWSLQKAQAAAVH